MTLGGTFTRSPREKSLAPAEEYRWTKLRDRKKNGNSNPLTHIASSVFCNPCDERTGLFLGRTQTVEKTADQPRNLIGRFVEREMPCFQKVNFRCRNVIGISSGARNRERGVIFPPHH